MNAFIEATKWPMGFEPDDTTSLLQCTIVNERTSVGTSVGQHVHQTGQFVVALSGLVGLHCLSAVLRSLGAARLQT